MVSLSRVYGHKAVYLLFLSIFTLLWEFALAAKAYAEDRSTVEGIMPTGVCAELRNDPACQASRRLLSSIVNRKDVAARREIEKSGDASVAHVTYGALIILGRTSHEYLDLLRRNYVTPKQTNLAFAIRGTVEVRGAWLPRLPIAELRKMGIDPNSGNAVIPDVFLAIVMQDSVAYRYLVTEFDLRPEMQRDNAGNGLAHYLARFATDYFKSEVSDLIPRLDQDAATENLSGQTPSNIMDSREDEHGSEVVNKRTENLASIRTWLGLELRPFELAMAQAN